MQKKFFTKENTKKISTKEMQKKFFTKENTRGKIILQRKIQKRNCKGKDERLFFTK